MSSRISRRRFVSGLIGGAGVVALASCGRDRQAREVVLYSSVDDPILRPIVGEFEKASGITVRVVGDTEATKSTGLIERLLLDKDSPRADVWWSSEPLGVIELARAGALEAIESKEVSSFPGGWPVGLRGAGGLWFGFGLRARVMAWSTKRLKADEAPRRLGDLAHARFKGRVAMARPQFGTTRVQLAALLASRGGPAVKGWLEAMRANGVRLLDGNSSVVRAIAQGEADVGLTDTDDVHAAKANGWNVEMAFEEPGSAEDAIFGADGPLAIPNTVARIRGGPNPRQAAELLDFLLSERNEVLLAESDSRNLPVHPGLGTRFPALAISGAWMCDWENVGGALAESSRLVREVLAPG